MATKAVKPDIRIIGCAPAIYPSFTAMMRGVEAHCGRPTIAEGVALKRVGELTYGVARPPIDGMPLLEAFPERAGVPIAKGQNEGWAQKAAFDLNQVVEAAYVAVLVTGFNMPRSNIKFLRGHPPMSARQIAAFNG